MPALDLFASIVTPCLSLDSELPFCQIVVHPECWLVFKSRALRYANGFHDKIRTVQMLQNGALLMDDVI